MNCKTCKYWDTWVDPVFEKRYCLRYPTIVLKSADNWCGEYAPQEPPEAVIPTWEPHQLCKCGHSRSWHDNPGGPWCERCHCPKFIPADKEEG
jgi:hypothetical protein